MPGSVHGMGLWVTWSGKRCPCTWQGIGTGWALKVTSNLNHSKFFKFFSNYRFSVPTIYAEMKNFSYFLRRQRQIFYIYIKRSGWSFIYVYIYTHTHIYINTYFKNKTHVVLSPRP